MAGSVSGSAKVSVAAPLDHPWVPRPVTRGCGLVVQ